MSDRSRGQAPPVGTANEEDLQRYKSLIENSPDAVIVHAGGVVTHANPAFLKLVDARDLASVLGASVAKFVEPEGRPRVAERIRAVLAGAVAPQEVVRVRTLTGRLAFVECTGIPTTWNGEQAVMTIARDITLQVEAQAARESSEAGLRASEARRLDDGAQFHDLFRNVPVGLYRTTPDGHILLVNDALAALLREPGPTAFLDRNLETGGEPSYSRAEFRRLVEAEGAATIESTWTRKDGTTFIARERVRAVRDEEGRVVHYDGSVEDVTELRATAAALNEKADALRLLFDESPLPIWLFDDKTLEILDVNHAATAVYGYTRDEFLALSLIELRPPEDVKRFLAERSTRDLSKPRQMDARHRRKDGTILHVLVTAAPLTLGGRRVAIAITQDLTEHDRATESLRRSERLASLGTLVAGVAHEINNPLSYLAGNVELSELTIREVLEGPDVPERVRVALREVLAMNEIALKGVAQIAHVTKSLKLVARAPGGARTSEDVNELVRAASVVARSRLPSGVEVTFDLESKRRVLVNAGEISQVLLNLVLNAGDAVANAAERAITLGTRDEGNCVVIEVRDTGAGIPEALRAQLFTPFHTTKPEGTGLGLSISHGIMRAHGGSLEFETRPGAGTVFRATLPQAP